MTEYKRLGDYIREVNVRNWELKVTKPMGINIDKHFMPSVANVIGTDLSAYKLVSKNQFACNLMHVGRDEKTPMAMHLDDTPIIVSPAYFVFEIVEPDVLLPEYLMMWFRRKEFDRNAWFYTDADVRGGMSKEALMDMRLPIPSTTRQREIVSEYETLTNCICLNNQMIQHLETTAQALYRKTFVDNIDKENLPEGWRMGTLGDLCVISSSKRIFENEYCHRGVPFYRGKEITQKKNGEQISDLIFISQTRYNELVRDYGKPKCGDILLTAVGTIGNSYMVQEEEFYFKDGNIVWLHNFIATGASSYIYEFFQSQSFEKLISEIAIGSTQKALTIQSLTQLEMPIPNKKSLQTFGNSIQIIYNDIKIKRQENDKLTELQSLLLAKMG
jgi:restriction endonuclease S subunit